MRIHLAILCLTIGALAASPAFAHAHLKNADPAADAKVHAPVAHIDLHYSEALEAHFSKATLADAKGHAIAAASAVDTADAEHLVLKPELPLTAGTYHVEWHVVSVDTHKTQGSYQFTVLP